MENEIKAIEIKINELPQYKKYSNHVDKNIIDMIEDKLNVKLPDSYKWFLIKYNMLLISGLLILGVGLTDDPICVDRTQKYRRFGLPEYLVVIEDEGDERLICLDTSRMYNGECPIVMWTNDRIAVITDCYHNFYKFLEARLFETQSN